MGAQWRDLELERAPEGTTKAGAGADGRWVTNLTCDGVRHSTHDAITTLLIPFFFAQLISRPVDGSGTLLQLLPPLHGGHTGAEEAAQVSPPGCRDLD